MNESLCTPALPSDAQPRAAWRPGADLAAIRARARMLADVRAFFAERGVLEVETPVLGRAATTDPLLHSLSTHVSGRCYYLHTSPELAMKRLLAAGSGDIYQVCKVFRDGETGRHHNPEFSMLEWYRLGLDHHGMMGEVEALLAALLGTHGSAGSRRVSYRDVVEQHLGIDPWVAEAAVCVSAVEAAGVTVPRSVAADRDAVLDLAMSSVIGPRLGRDAPCFVYDYPASRAALASVRPGSPPVAERFELYLHGVELANGFRELTDAAEQRRRFQHELLERRREALQAVPVDEAFLAALDHGLPQCAGVAMGLDRLLMLAVGARGLGEVLAFSIERA